MDVFYAASTCFMGIFSLYSFDEGHVKYYWALMWVRISWTLAHAAASSCRGRPLARGESGRSSTASKNGGAGEQLTARDACPMQQLFGHYHPIAQRVA
jgi:hypothetical protein